MNSIKFFSQCSILPTAGGKEKNAENHKLNLAVIFEHSLIPTEVGILFSLAPCPKVAI